MNCWAFQMQLWDLQCLQQVRKNAFFVWMEILFSKLMLKYWLLYCRLLYSSPAGTSLPNYVASKVAAEKGFGNQAVSNAFGSNTFNIMCGLGLPWMLYISLGNNFEPYNGLKDEHIVDSIVILAGMLGIFVAFMFASDFVIYQWHGIVFLMGYGGYLVYAIMVDA